MTLRTKIEEAIKPTPETYEEPVPHWLRYDVVCKHDDGIFCDHRQKYAVDKICTIFKEELKSIDEWGSQVDFDREFRELINSLEEGK